MEHAIAVLSDVSHLSGILGGAVFGAARLVPSGSRLRLELELLPAPSAGRRRGAPAAATHRLILEQVTEATLRHVATVPTDQPLVSCEAVRGGYQVVVAAPDGLRLELSVEQLSGRLVALG